MFSVYYSINNEILKKLNDDSKKIIIDFINKEKRKGDNVIKDTSQIKDYYTIELMDCPFCGANLLEIIFGDWENTGMCPFCLGVSPNDKINYSLNSAKKLIDLISYLNKKKTKTNEEWIRTIEEQIIVIIATGIEVYLRDVYSMGLNMRFVKHNRNLFNRFHDDTKNKFTNITKANKLFKKDLKINIKNIIGEEYYSCLKLLSEKRNAIVHNSGFADKKFISNSGLDCESNEKIPIDIVELKQYIKIIKKIVSNFDKQFKKEVISYVIKKIESNIDNIDKVTYPI